MNYTLHQLQVFLKIAELKSVTKAAEALHLTQPAVSIQLKNFQDQFEIPLTEIIGRRLFVTEFGQEIAHAAANILEEVYAINYKALAHKGLLSGKLRFSSVSTGKYILPYLIAPFIQKHDGIEVQIDVTNRRTVHETLERNEVDFALVSIKPDKLVTEGFDLMENEMYWISSTSPEGNQANSKLKHEGPNMIFREEGSATRKIMEEYLLSQKIDIPKKLELSSNEAVKQAIVAGIGESLMPLIGIRNELQLNQLYVIPHSGLPIRTTWQLIWLKNKQHSPAGKAFLNYIEENLEELRKVVNTIKIG